MNYKSSYFILTCLGFGFAFLYIPILSMVVFSFNASKLVTVWDAANSPTLKWYHALLNNEEILDAAWISLKVAVINASGSVILGTLAGFGLARFSQFRGRFTLNAMTTAPLVMPEVITGLSLLLLFVALEQLIGWPAGRGITTMTIGHMTFSMAYVTVIVNSRFVGVAAGFHSVMGRSGDLELHIGTRQQHLAHGGVLEGASGSEPRNQRARDHHHLRRDLDDRLREFVDGAGRQAR
jgi:ABC-type spermidine/putrescine transport system permease subunit II